MIRHRRICSAHILLSTFVLLSAAGNAQEKPELPNDLGQLIERKTELLARYSKLQEAGSADEAIGVLREIINIHRKSVQVAISNQEAADLIEKLRNVYVNDTEFMSDQLFQRGEYAESAALRKELEEFLTPILGEQHRSTVIMHWKAVTADRLAKASRAKQTAYVEALAIEPQATQALADGNLKEATQLYLQLIDAQVAVLGEAHPKVAADLNEYGRALWLQKNFPAAEAVYHRSLKVREASTGRDLQYATTTFNLGRVYQDTNRYEKAEEMYLQTAAIEEPALGSRNPSFLQTLNQLAILYDLMGESEKKAAVQQRISAADPLATVLAHMPKGTYAAAAVEPVQLPQVAGLQMLPFEVMEAAGREQLGVSPLDIEALVALATLPISDPPINYGFLFRLKDGVTATFPWQVEGASEVVTFGDGLQYLKSSTGNSQLCAVEYEDGVVLVGTEECVRQSLSQPDTGPVGAMLLADREAGQLNGAVDMKLIRGFVQAGLQEMPALPPELEPLRSLPGEIDSMHLRVDLSRGLMLSLTLDATDVAAAEQTVQTLTNALAYGQQAAAAQIAEELAGEQPVDVATRKYVQRVASTFLQQLAPVQAENTVTLSTSLNDSTIVAPIAVALLLPAVQGARDAAQRSEDMNSLKMIGLAMHNYHEVYGRFPARANYDADGRPLLSWRVHLLPFLEQNSLYEQFHLNEPWDSEHNLPLAEQMPAVFRSQQFSDATRTVFLTLDGVGTAMESTEGRKLAEFTDGLSNTLLVVEANAENAVTWTKPEDLPFDPTTPGNGVGAIRDNGFLGLLSDGAVRLIPADLPADTLRNLMQRNDGQVVPEF